MNAPLIKSYPADFYVEERLHFALDEQGEHLWLWIEKSGMNTAFVKRQLARLSACPIKDIAHSGLKDRHAITRQWFSLPAKYGDALPERYAQENEYWQILEKHRHGRKLRIGSHRENFFRLIVRNIDAQQQSQIEAQLAQIQQQGFPNYFEKQRFGYENLAQARQWAARGKLPKGHEERSRVLSTLRAALFNAQLEARVADGSWQQLRIGDRALLAGSNSHFLVETLDEALLARLTTGDISPALCLIGQSQSQTKAPIPSALDEWQVEHAYLLQYMQEDWRAMRVIPQALEWQWQAPDCLALQFLLPRGAYATALLHHLLPNYQDAQELTHE